MASPANPFESDSRFRRLLVPALQQISQRLAPSLEAEDEALLFVESLCWKLLHSLLQPNAPHLQDVEERVQRLFPHPLDKTAVQDLHEKTKRKSHALPVDRLHALLSKELNTNTKLEHATTAALAAVVEFVAVDVLTLAGRFVENCRHATISATDVRVAMCADEALMRVFFPDDDAPDDDVFMQPAQPSTQRLTYEDVVRELLQDLKQFVRDLALVLRLFRAPLEERHSPATASLVCGPLDDVLEAARSALAGVEDALEAAQQADARPTVGGVFEELAEAQELDVFEAQASHAPPDRAQLKQLAANVSFPPPVAFQHVLPRLMLRPAQHVLQLIDWLSALRDLSACEDDRESLAQALGLLAPLRRHVERAVGRDVAKRALRLGRVPCAPAERVGQQELVRALGLSSVGALLLELDVFKTSGGRSAERRAFVFEHALVLCKQTGGRPSDWRVKEKISLKNCDVQVPDELTLELSSDGARLVVVTRSPDDLSLLAGQLLLSALRPQLERALDQQLQEEDRRHPLLLPPVQFYRFSEPDVENKNIVTVDGVLRAATRLKLVERLTFHQFADPAFVRVFLTTFRSFVAPKELLDLLIERFDIPEPEDASREQLSKFRREFVQPVQFRVLNVLRHWTDQHFYDFERDGELLVTLRAFLSNVKSMRKWVQSIEKTIERRLQPSVQHTLQSFSQNPPAIEWHLTKDLDKFHWLTLHPVEVARQWTLVEHELYRAVRPAELVGTDGTVWTRADKHKTSPNLLKMIERSTRLTLSVERAIIDCENLEERVAVLTRFLEILHVLMELNNLNGALEVVSALNSACVHRLEHTFSQALAQAPSSTRRVLEEAKELSEEHFRKYQERLRSLNPPVVPFLGVCLTNILHIEEGNADTIDGLVNFAKRRKVAEITAEIQQYQHQPYCLQVQPEIRAWLEQLDPFDWFGRALDEKELNDELYTASLRLEPRGQKPLKADRRWPELNLKSPGVKLKHTRQFSIQPLTILNKRQPNESDSETQVKSVKEYAS